MNELCYEFVKPDNGKSIRFVDHVAIDELIDLVLSYVGGWDQSENYKVWLTYNRAGLAHPGFEFVGREVPNDVYNDSGFITLMRRQASGELMRASCHQIGMQIWIFKHYQSDTDPDVILQFRSQKHLFDVPTPLIE